MRLVMRWRRTESSALFWPLDVPARLRKRPIVRITLEELVEPDAQAIATETFRPGLVARQITKGTYLRLSDPVVRQFPQFFSLAIPVTQLDRSRPSCRSEGAAEPAPVPTNADAARARSAA